MLRYVFTQSPVFSGAFWYLIEKLVRLAGAFLLGAWVAKYLGAENYGYLAYSVALVAMLSFLGSWGIESLIVRDLARGPERQREIISTYFFLRLLGGIIIPPCALAYVYLAHEHEYHLMVLVALCSGVVVFSSFDVMDCWLQSRHQARVTSIVRLVGFVFGAVLKIVLVQLGMGVEWFAVAALFEAAVIGGIYFFIMIREGLCPSLSECSLKNIKNMFLDGRVMALSGLAVIVYSKVDVLVVGGVLSAEVLGPYAIAASMCAAWNMVGSSIVQAWAPHLSVSTISGREAYIRSLRKMLFLGLAVVVVGCGVLHLIIGYVFDFLLGDGYKSGVPIARVLLWGGVFVFFGVATSQIIVNERIYWVSLFRTVVGVVVTLVAVVPVAEFWGAKGVAGLVVLSAAISTLSILISKAARKTLAAVFFLR